MSEPFRFVPRGLTGWSLGVTPCGVLTARGPDGGETLSPGRFNPLNWDWDDVLRLLSFQLTCGSNLRSTRVTSGEVGPGRETRAREIQGDLYQLLEVLPRVTTLEALRTGSVVPMLDPSGVLVLAGRGLVRSPEGLGRLDGVFSIASLARGANNPTGQAHLVDGSIWSRAHVSSWRRSEVTVNGRRVSVAVPEEERHWGVSCPVRFIEAPDLNVPPPPTISLPPAVIQFDARRLQAGKVARIISWVSPVDLLHKEVVGGLARVADPAAYAKTPGVGPGVEWAAVADVPLEELLGEEGPPPERKPPPPPPQPPPPKPPEPPPPWFPPPGGPDLEEEFDDFVKPPKPPKPPAVGPEKTDDPIAVPGGVELVEQDDADEQQEGPQGREAFEDDEGTATAVRDGAGTPVANAGVFSTAGAVGGGIGGAVASGQGSTGSAGAEVGSVGGNLVLIADPGAALVDEATRTGKESVPCPLTTTPKSAMRVGEDGKVYKTSPDGSQIPINALAGPIDKTTAEDRQCLIDSVLAFSPIPSPGTVGAASTPWGAIRQIVEKVNEVVAIVGGAFVGGRWSYYKGNLAVITDQLARNIIGRHLTNPDTSVAPVQPGLNVYQGVTADSVSSTVDRPAQTTTRALRGDVTATAPVLKIEKRVDRGAVDVTPYLDCGNGKYQVLDSGATTSPGAELRRTAADPIRSAADGLSVNSSGQLCYSTGGVRTALTSGGGIASGSAALFGSPQFAYETQTISGTTFPVPNFGPWGTINLDGNFSLTPNEPSLEAVSAAYGGRATQSYLIQGVAIDSDDAEMAWLQGPSLPSNYADSMIGAGGLSVTFYAEDTGGAGQHLAELVAYDPSDGTTEITTGEVEVSYGALNTITLSAEDLAGVFQARDVVRCRLYVGEGRVSNNTGNRSINLYLQGIGLDLR